MEAPPFPCYFLSKEILLVLGLEFKLETGELNDQVATQLDSTPELNEPSRVFDFVTK